MKSKIICIVLSFCIFFCACSGDPPFSVDGIKAIYLNDVNPSIEPVEVPDELLDEARVWLESFSLGKQIREHQLAPGQNSVSIIIEYDDGRIFECGIDAISQGDKLYLLAHDDIPENILEIMK